MKTKFLWSTLALAMLASCSDSKKDDPTPDPDPNPNPDPTEEIVYTPEQSKTFLQQTAVEFMDNFKPADQKEAMEIASYFMDRYGYYEMPEDFYDAVEDSYAPATYIKAVGKAARGNTDAMGAAVYTYTYRVNFSDFTGIYEPNSRYEQWERTGDSDKIIFRYYGSDGNPVELTVSQDGGNSVIDETIGDDWEEDRYILSIPKTVNISLTSGSKTIAVSKIVSSIDVNGHTLSAEQSSTVANITLNETLKGTDTSVRSESQYFVGGKMIASKKAVVNGQNLCDKDHYMEGRGLRIDKIEGEADILGKVQFYATLNYYSQLEDDMDSWFDSWDYNDKATARMAAQNACERLSRNLNAYICYNGTTTKQASLLPTVEYDEWGYGEYSGWEYYIDMVLSFPDNTKYSFDSYFDSFTSVTNKAESLVEAYERMWNSIR